MIRGAGAIALGIGMLVGCSDAEALDCYGSGGGRLAEVGDFSRYRDLNQLYTASVVTSESYDSLLDVQRVTSQTVGGPFDGRLSFSRRTPSQNLNDGWDQQTVVPNLGLVTASTRYVPPVPTSFPICPGATQESQGSVVVSALGLTICTGTYQRTISALEWENITVPFGSFRSLRVNDDFTLMFDCDGSSVETHDVVWLAPGLGAARIDSGSNSRVLVDTSYEPIPEPEQSLALLTAALALGGIAQARRYGLDLAFLPLTRSMTVSMRSAFSELVRSS